MLAGVDNDRFNPGLVFKGMIERGYFHEIRPGGSDQVDFGRQWYTSSEFNFDFAVPDLPTFGYPPPGAPFKNRSHFAEPGNFSP
jgi:hypothetical protein